MTDEDRQAIEHRCRQLGEEPPSHSSAVESRRRGELRSPSGETLMNNWAVVCGDKPLTVRPVYGHHAALATPGCLWLMGGATYEVASVGPDGWVCVVKGGEA